MIFSAGCNKVSYSMRSTLTVSLPPKMRGEVTRAAKGLGISESDFVRRAIQEQLWQESVEASRRILVPKARAKGIYTDEDVFDIVS